jgi:hypothetical protein
MILTGSPIPGRNIATSTDVNMVMLATSLAPDTYLII